MRRTLQLLIFLLAGASLGFAQQEQNCPTQHLVVNVINANNTPVPELQPKNFRVQRHGHLIPVTSVRAENRPIRVVILLDLSDSMVGTPQQFNLARQFAGDVVNSMTLGNQLALLTFSDEVTVRGGLTADRNDLLQALIALDPKKHTRSIGGHTALLDGIQAAISTLGTPQLGDVIYVITDGGENRSHADFGQIKRTLMKSSIRMFFAMLLQFVPRTPEEQEGPIQMGELAADTGGRAMGFNVQDKSQVIGAGVVQLYHRMQQFYVLDVEGIAPASKPEDISVFVLDETGKLRKNVGVTYPTKIFPCSM